MVNCDYDYRAGGATDAKPIKWKKKKVTYCPEFQLQNDFKYVTSSFEVPPKTKTEGPH